MRALRRIVAVCGFTLALGAALGSPAKSAGSGDVPPAATAPEARGREGGDAGEPQPASSGHEDPVTPVLLAISIILLAAKVGGDLMIRASQPAVLGELLFGVLLGNLAFFGWEWFEFLRPPAAHGTQAPHGLGGMALDMLARIGVVLLLFEVGLESSIKDMTRVGWSSLLVAVLGVITPMGLGWAASRLLLPNESWHVHAFIGATLCATSVGITARVLKDLGKTETTESKIILGAAVIDDVLGLVVLAVVQAIIVKGSPSAWELALIVGKAFLFLAGSVLLGDWLSPRLFGAASKLRGHGLLLATGIAFCFTLAWIASVMGLAPIVGAFAAGLILDERHYAALAKHEERSLEDFVLPVTALLVPIFFVMVGFQVELKSFLDPAVLWLAAGLTVAAVLGKLVCGLGVLQPGVNRWSVGFGMLPRGEVGLVFIAIGQGLIHNGEPIINASIYAAVVLMIMITTLATPPLLRWTLRSAVPAAKGRKKPS